jgi:uncharacterized protein (TIGR03437 family)
MCASALFGGSMPQPPSYTAAGLVNSADNMLGPMAPNTIATLYGTGLADGTEALISNYIRDNTIPTVLPFSSVRIFVGSSALMAGIYYVSPTQINFLLPAEMPLKATTIRVERGSLVGDEIPITIIPMTPAFYMLDAERVVAQHLDGSVIRTDHAAQPGEIVILYATGLGQTLPKVRSGEVCMTARRIAGPLTILLDGKPVDAKNLLYAGTAPGFAGLYQINLRLPVDAGVDPEIRMAAGDQVSPPHIRLVVRPPD